MKPILCSIIGLMCAVTQVAAQGTIYFSNNNAARVTNALTLEPLVGGTIFRAALYYLPDQPATPTEADFDLGGQVLGSPVGFLGNATHPSTGLFNGGVRNAPVTNDYANHYGWFQVRVWETAFGATYDAARANSTPQEGRLALLGVSSILRVQLGNPTKSGGQQYPGSLIASGLTGFFVGLDVQAIPEASPELVLVAGTVGLWLFGRRRPKPEISDAPGGSRD